MICDWLWNVNVLYWFLKMAILMKWISCGCCSLPEHTVLDDSHRALQVFLPRIRAWRCLNADGRNILPGRSPAHVKIWDLVVHSAWVYSWWLASRQTELEGWHSPKFCVLISGADLRISLLAQVFAWIYIWKLRSMSCNAGQWDEESVFEVSTSSLVLGCFES